MVRVEFEHWFSVSGWEEGYTPPLAQQTERLSQVHKGVEIDPTKPKRYDIYTTIWGGWMFQFGPLTTGLADRLVSDPDGCLGLTSRQCVINYNSGGVSGGAHVRVRSGNIEYTGGLWYLPVYSASIFRSTGNAESVVSFFMASAGFRYFPEFLPEALRGIFAGVEVGYGIPLIQNSVAGSPKSLDLGTYITGALSFGYQYRLGSSVSIEAGTQVIVMPTKNVMLGAMPYVGASYHL